MTESSIRLAVDIGGAFTDVVVESARGRHTRKVLTTPAAPEEGVMDGMRRGGKTETRPTPFGFT